MKKAEIGEMWPYTKEARNVDSHQEVKRARSPSPCSLQREDGPALAPLLISDFRPLEL